MTKYTHNNHHYNCIDISTQKRKIFKVYRTKGREQTYLHFENNEKHALYTLVKSAADGDEYNRDIVESLFITKSEQSNV